MAQGRYSYDQASQYRRRTNFKSDASVIVGFAYDYDAAGNRPGVLESGGNRETWTYDAANRLTREQRRGPGLRHGLHVRRARQSSGESGLGRQDDLTYDLASQLRTSQDSSSVTSYTYDLASNLTVVQEPTTPASGCGTTRTGATSVLSPGRAITTCTYRFDGLRCSKEDSEGTTKHLWTSATTWAKRTKTTNSSRSTRTARGVRRPDRPVSRGPDDLGPSCYHCDALGSTRAPHRPVRSRDGHVPAAPRATSSPSADPRPVHSSGGTGRYYYDDLLATVYGSLPQGL